MTLNFGALDNAIGQEGGDIKSTATAGLWGHEATHGADGSGFTGMFRAAGWLLSGEAKLNWERRAFTTEANIFKAFNLTEPQFTLWNPAWAKLDLQTQRENIKKVVDSTVLTLYGSQSQQKP